MLMPKIRGVSLKKHLKRGERFSVGESLRIVVEVIEAVEEAHKQRVIHGDLRPSNIVLEGDRRRALVINFNYGPKSFSEENVIATSPMHGNW